MAHSDCGWTCGCAGKTVKSLENTCRTWALLLWWFTTKRRYMHLSVSTFARFELLLRNRASVIFRALCRKNYALDRKICAESALDVSIAKQPK